MPENRVLIFTRKFIDDKEPDLQSRLFGEYQNLSKKIKLVIVSGSVKKNNYDNIRIIEASFLKFPFFQKFFQSLSFLIAAINARNDYEIIFSRMLEPMHIFPAVVVKFLFKKKLIVWFSGSGHIRRGGLGKKIIQMGLNFADYFGAIYETQIREMEFLGAKINKKKVFYTNPGVNLLKFKPEKTKSQNDIILTVSRIVPVKQIEDSIKVIPLLKENFPDIKLKIAGVPTDKNYFKKLKNLVIDLNCEDFIEFIGPVPNNRLDSIYNSSKLFIFTSKHEGQPGVLLEAMACGLPIISTPVGIVPKIIKDGINGYIIKNEDTKIIAKRISLLLTNEKLRNDMGLAARKTMEKECSLDEFTNTLIYYFKKSMKI